MASEKYGLAQGLLDVPQELIMMTDEEMGKQIVADFDYFLHVEKNGKSYNWLFDEPEEGLSEEVQQYLEKVIAVNEQLSE
ncbi:hypothetical protein [Zunongwangia sp. H14]|uniref:hypothetical protein n=1 Tax=Zunongwangia sp. H14 TaxID=3240792 RepID=UPI003562F7BA